MTEPGQDPELLRAVIASDTESAALLTWAIYASQVQTEGTLTFPIRTVDDLDPLFAAALDDGVAQDKVDLYRSCVPPAAFPLATFEEFLRWTRLVIDVVHRLEDDPGRKWRRRH
jgi:hypothetical protein